MPMWLISSSQVQADIEVVGSMKFTGELLVNGASLTTQL